MSRPSRYTYSAFGLALRSSLPIPGLNAVEDRSAADITIWMDARPPGLAGHEAARLWYPTARNDEHADGLKVWRLCDGPFFRFQYADATEFFVNQTGTEVYATWPDSSTLEDSSIYLLGPVLGFALSLRGITCLHASAVAIRGQAVALLGAGQAGKSTTAAAFAQLGYPVLTDDVAPLIERGGVTHLQPAYPQLRLWPDSVALLYGSGDALPPLTPTWTKRALDLSSHGYAFQSEPLPLAAVYVLGDRGDRGQPSIEPVAGRDRLRTLLAHSYVGYLLDRNMREQQFLTLTRAFRIPMRRVISADGASQVFRLCSRILEECEAIGCTPSPTMAR